MGDHCQTNSRLSCDAERCWSPVGWSLFGQTLPTETALLYCHTEASHLVAAAQYLYNCSEPCVLPRAPLPSCASNNINQLRHWCGNWTGSDIAQRVVL
ncbi:hypothetical protein WJX77_001396 [Trebouxia sp. C0004]